MDKYEYNLKLDEIEKLASEGEFEEAAEIADTIDWRKVKNVRILCTVSEIYEQLERLEDCKTLLARAYQRSQIGKSVLYRLIDVSIKMGDFEEAVDYYSQYIKVAPRDVNRYILKYKIFKGRGSSIDDQIRILEDYLSVEYTEKWAYELITLYDKAGYTDKCVRACDELILWFHSGKYVIKALELKQKYTALSPVQQEAYDNRLGQIVSEEEGFEEEEEFEAGEPAAEASENGEEDPEFEEEVKAAVVPDYRTVLSGLRKAVVKQPEKVYGIQKAPEITFEKESPEEVKEPNAVVTGSASSLSAAVAASKQQSEKPAPTIADLAEKLQIDTEQYARALEDARLAELERQALAAEEEIEVEAEEEPEEEPENYSTELDNLDNQGMREELANSIHQIISGLGYGNASDDENSVYLKHPETYPVNAEEAAETEEEPEIEAESIDSILTGMASRQKQNIKTEATEETESDDLDDLDIDLDLEEADSNRREIPEISLEDDLDDDISVEAEFEEEAKAAQKRTYSEEIYVPEDDDLDFDLDDIEVDLGEEFPEEEPEEESEEAEEVEEEFEDEELEKEDFEEEEEVSEDEEDEEEFEDEDEEFEDDGFDEEETDDNGFEEEFEEEFDEEDFEDEDDEEEFEDEDDEEEFEDEDDDEEFEDEDDDEEFEDEDDEEEFEDEDDDEEFEDEDDDEEEEDEEDETARKASEALKRTLESLEKQVAESNKEIEEEEKRKENQRKKIVTLKPEEKERFEYYCGIKGMERQIATAIHTIEERGDAKTSQTGNLIVLGRKASGKTTIALSVIESANARRGKDSLRVAKIFAADLNHKDLVEVITKIAGGVLIIEEAGDLNEVTARKLAKLMNARTEGLLIVLEDEKKYISEVLTKYPDLISKFTAKINIPVVTSDELIKFAHYYADSIDCALTEDSEEALYSIITQQQNDGRVTTIGTIKEILDAAKLRAGRFGIGKMTRVIAKKEYDSEDRLILLKKYIREV